MDRLEILAQLTNVGIARPDVVTRIRNCVSLFSVDYRFKIKKKKKKTTWIRTHIFHMLSLVSSFPLKIYTMGMD